MVHKLPTPSRPRKLTLKGYRQHWVVFKDTTLSYYKSQDEAPGDPIQQLNLKGEGGASSNCSQPVSSWGPGWIPSALRQLWVGGLTFTQGPLSHLLLAGCEVVPDVNVSGQKFCIKLLVPSPEGMSEIYLRCQDVSRLGRRGNGSGRARGQGWNGIQVRVNVARSYSRPSLSVLAPGPAVRTVDGCLPPGLQGPHHGRQQLCQ